MQVGASTAQKHVVQDVAQNTAWRTRVSRRWSIEVPQNSSSSLGAAKAADGAQEGEGSMQMLGPESRAVLIDDRDLADAESDALLRVLRKPPDARSEEELQTVMQKTQNVNFFRH